MASTAPVHLSLNATIDVQSTVNKLLQVETAKIDKVKTQQTDLQAGVAAWADINSSLTSLATNANTLRDWQTWNTMTVDSTDPTTITATASSNAMEANYTIDVTHLARAHSVAGSRAVTLGLTGIDDVLVGKVAGLSVGDQFTIGGAGGQAITIAANDTLSTLRSKINTAAESLPANSKVVATILDTRLVITRVNSGSTQLALADTTGSPLDKLGIKTGAVYNNELEAAQDALFSVNGASVTRSSNTNLSDVITGVSLTLVDSSATSQTLKVGRDREVVKNAINAVITDYNAAVKKLQAYTIIDLSNPKSPVTGLLQSDTTASPILFNLRKLIGASGQPYMNATNASYDYNGQTGILASLDGMGIGTSDEHNNISITDQARLDSVLTNNFDKAEQLMRGVYVDGSGYQHGVADGLYNYASKLSTTLIGDIAMHSKTLQGQVNDLTTKITTMTDDLATYEQSLWNQFDAMDQAMSNATTQIGFITNTFKASA